MSTIELTNNEERILWNIINYHQSQGLHRNADLLTRMENNEQFQEILRVWNQETIDEWKLLYDIKKKLLKNI